MVFKVEITASFIGKIPENSTVQDTGAIFFPKKKNHT